MIKGRVDGISRYAYEVLSRMTRLHPEDHFVFLFDRQPDPSFIFSDNVTPVVLSPQARHPLLFVWWFELSVAGFLQRLKPDVFFSPDGFLSLRAGCKQVAVIHDINFAHYPEGLPRTVDWYYNYFFPRFATKADAILTVSEFSKKDLIETYHLPERKVHAILNGPGKRFPQISEEEKLATRDAFSGGQPYFLFAGTLLPRKNVVGMLKAFDRFCEQNDVPHHLVLAGGRYLWTDEMEQALRNIPNKHRVHFTGKVSDEQMGALIHSAACLLFIPLFEGFGFPVLEAFAAHIPVVASRVSSLPEVGKDLAFYCDPMDPSSAAAAMREALSQSLPADAFEQVLSSFSWERCAQETYEILRQTADAEANH